MRFSPQNCSLPQATVGVWSDITSTPDAFIKCIYEKKRLEKVLNLTRTVGVTLRVVMGQKRSSCFCLFAFFFVCSQRSHVSNNIISPPPIFYIFDMLSKPKGLVKKYRGGWAGTETGRVMRFLALCKGWVVQFSATLRGWLTLFYCIDRH